MLHLTKAVEVATTGAAENAGGLADLSFDPSRILEMLPRMGIGMLVIFVVIGVIALSTVVINKIFATKDK